MRQPWLLKFILALLAGALASQAQQGGTGASVHGLGSNSWFTSEGGTNFFYNGGVASNQSAVVTFDKASEVESSGVIIAEGDVTILDHGHVWRGTNFIYNLKTGEVRAGWFKTRQAPYSIEGHSMGGTSNKIESATNAIISTDDYAKPFFTVHAKTITIAPGDYLEARHATIYLGSVPIFYYPYYRRSLKPHPDNFEFVPGYRSRFGPYLLSAYNWYGSNSTGLGAVDGTLHLDERERRGLAGGPDFALHMGNWGEAAFRYYYAHDIDPGADSISAPHLGENRQRGQFYYEVHPASNVTAKVFANYQSDPLVIRDFYEGEYNKNVEPASFAEVSDLGRNWVLDGMFQPRLVNFFETVERLPDLKLTGLRQEVGVTPIFYDSETSAGYFERAFSETNVPLPFTNYGVLPNGFGTEEFPGRLGGYPNYSAARVDTFHQFSLPETFFGWLNVTPLAGGRATYYSDVDGPQVRTNQQGRGIFNTGMDVSFKASRVYKNVNSDFFDLDGVRHIMQPEIDYAYVPFASSHVPLFDYQSPNLRLLPIDFPDYNDIDSIHSENVMRLMLRNKLQTKRKDGIEDFINWAVYTDWYLSGTNRSFADLYNDLDFRPRSWITFSSSTRYDLTNTRWREAIERVFLQPTTALSTSIGYYYLMNNDPEFQSFPGQTLPGHNLVDFSLYYRFDENWGARISERFEAQNGAMQEQLYSIYHDLRSWTAALTFRVNQGAGQPTDFAVGVTFSLKAFPRYKLNQDNDRPWQTFNSASTPTLFDDF
ncbi:MAG TPA: LPS assembly protein LptD [Verrucomicrobiae bacterium]|jgi:lipopolysaccharide assembly outer membrane protein LptD (OstA)